MAKLQILFMSIALILFQQCMAYREITGLLDDSANDLSAVEINALRPLFEELQLQYDHITRMESEQSKKNHKIDEQFSKLYASTIENFQKDFADFLASQESAATISYDIKLPTLEELIGNADMSQMTQQEINEFLDIQSILQETLDDTDQELKELIAKALEIESNFFKLNKPKIVMFVLNALGVGFGVAGRVGRAAYCTYSHVPQLNDSLHHIYDGVDCYTYATSVVLNIQHETAKTAKTVKKSIFELAEVYKKIASKKTIMGKITSAILNITKITRSILQTLRAANIAIDGLVNRLPKAIKEAEACATNFASKLPFLVETVTNTTECILFVDDSSNDYGFIEPEDSTRIPILPDSSEEEDSSEEYIL